MASLYNCNGYVLSLLNFTPIYWILRCTTSLCTDQHQSQIQDLATLGKLRFVDLIDSLLTQATPCSKCHGNRFVRIWPILLKYRQTNRQINCTSLAKLCKLALQKSMYFEFWVSYMTTHEDSYIATYKEQTASRCSCFESKHHQATNISRDMNLLIHSLTNHHWDNLKNLYKEV